MPTKVYAGIGARKAPLSVCTLMTQIARELSSQGYWLRTGGAEGADQAFAMGSLDQTIWYLPWPSYEKKNIGIVMRGYEPIIGCETPHMSAIAEARRYHPNPDAWTPGVEKLMGRNMHIISGSKLDTPVEFVVCWTPDGKDSGGTGQALRYAKSLNIPVYNLFNYSACTLAQIVKLILFPTAL